MSTPLEREIAALIERWEADLTTFPIHEDIRAAAAYVGVDECRKELLAAVERAAAAVKEVAMKVEITGESDDLIGVRGDIREEFDATDDGDDLLFSDGTIVRVTYDNDGIWRLGLRKQGRGIATLTTNESAPNPDSYSDSMVIEFPHKVGVRCEPAKEGDPMPEDIIRQMRGGSRPDASGPVRTAAPPDAGGERAAPVSAGEQLTPVELTCVRGAFSQLEKAVEGLEAAHDALTEVMRSASERGPSAQIDCLLVPVRSATRLVLAALRTEANRLREAGFKRP